MAQVSPNQIKGLEEAYKKLDNLGVQTKGIKIAAWVTAVSTLVIAIVSVLTLISEYGK